MDTQDGQNDVTYGQTVFPREILSEMDFSFYKLYTLKYVAKNVLGCKIGMCLCPVTSNLYSEHKKVAAVVKQLSCGRYAHRSKFFQGISMQ